MDNVIFKEVKGTDLYNARDLHNGLESKQKFSDWVKKRVLDCDLIENEDYIVFHKKTKNSKGGRSQIEHHLTLDSCKEIAMMERNDKGKAVRRWFIARDKELQLIKDQEKTRIEERNFARLGAPEMTDAIKELKEIEGKELKPYHFSNEHNLVYRVALGCTKKKYMNEILEIDNEDSLRDNLPPMQIKAVTDLQKMNTSLIQANIPYADRKRMLTEYYNRKHIDLIKEEIDRIEA